MKRITDLFVDLQARSIVIIRFNPDDYVNSQGIKITSCWIPAKNTGILIVKPTKRLEWNQRICCLFDKIEYWMSNQPSIPVEIIKLFYDNS